MIKISDITPGQNTTYDTARQQLLEEMERIKLRAERSVANEVLLAQIRNVQERGGIALTREERLSLASELRKMAKQLEEKRVRIHEGFHARTAAKAANGSP